MSPLIQARTIADGLVALARLPWDCGLRQEAQRAATIAEGYVGPCVDLDDEGGANAWREMARCLRRGAIPSPCTQDRAADALADLIQAYEAAELAAEEG